MPDGTIDLTALLAEVTRAKTVADSVEAFILTIGPRISAAVTAALEADASADQASIDAANAAITEAVTAIAGDHDRITTAILTNTPAAPPTP